MRIDRFNLLPVLFLIAIGIPAQAQGLRGLLKDYGSAVKDNAKKKADQTATDKIETPCVADEESAKVGQADEEKTGTWVIETADGKIFQLSAFKIVGQTEDGGSIAGLLGKAAEASFTLEVERRFTKVYRVHVDYSPAPAKDGVGGIFTSALNDTVQTRMVNDFKIEAARIEGTSLDGKKWCLNGPSNTLGSMRLIH